MSIPTADYDGAWKTALEEYLPEALALLAPDIHAAIDWSRGLTFLDAELQKVTADAALGQRAVDKLVRVWRRDGQQAWVLIHIEAQHQRDPTFPLRMFVYYSLLVARFGLPLVSLAILGDDEPGWRPDHWRTELWGCAIDFRYRMVKLLDYRADWAGLAAERNPFAAVVLAHLEAMATRRDAVGRLRAKLALVRRLYELGYDRAGVLRLFRLIDWLLRLPEELEDELWQAVRALEEERQVTYVTSVERIGIRKGVEQGRVEGRVEGLRAGLAVALELHFGEAGRAVAEELATIQEIAVLEAIAARLRTATTVDEVRAIFQPPTA